MAFYTEIWFWLLIIGIAFILIGVIFAFSHHTLWFIIFLLLGIFFIIIAIIAAAVSGGAHIAQQQSESLLNFAKSPEGQQTIQQLAPLLLA